MSNNQCPQADGYPLLTSSLTDTQITAAPHSSARFIHSRFSMALTRHFIFFLLVHGAGEGISEGDGSKEHLDADDKVLPARCHRASADLLSIDEERVGYDPAAFQDGEDHSYKSGDIFSITSSYN